jgi:hypothetical protein
MIIRPGGLPLYSQSLNFPTDFECQTFNERISNQDIDPILVAGLFDAIKSFFSEIMHENFRMIDVGFFSYRISGLVMENRLFMGIFEIRKEGVALTTEEFMPYIAEIAETFTKDYSKALERVQDYNTLRFEGFTNKLVNMGYSLSLQDCRDCLTKCIDENKECLPHLYYYKDVVSSTN